MVKIKMTDNPASKKVKAGTNTMKPRLNDNEQAIFDIIASITEISSGHSCTMKEIIDISSIDTNLADSSVMVYVGNLKRKGYTARDNKKNITITK